MSGPVRYWAPPLRDEGTGHRVSGYPGRRPMRSRDLPGPRPEGVGLVAWWRCRLALWLAEYPMRWAARGMGRLPEVYGDMTEPDPEAGRCSCDPASGGHLLSCMWRLDGCTCDAPAGSHRPPCQWAAR
jgi:hypothetical protein